MKVISSVMPDGCRTWGVFDKNNEVVSPILQYLTYLQNLERSPNTLRAYAYHLKHFWEYLTETKFDWKTIKLDQLAGFITWLRSSKNITVIHQTMSKRTESSINAVLAAVTAFYKFHEQIGAVENLNLYTDKISINPRYKPFLHHLNTSKLAKTRTLKIKVPTRIPKALDQQIVGKMLSACYYMRDKFLICLLYETGMRIGQAIGLRHTDIQSFDNTINIIPRINNQNESRSKSNYANAIPVSQALMKLYTEYVLAELENFDSDYVFVCLKGKKRGQPLRYTAVQDLFIRLSKIVGKTVTPHMLRHTHATDLVRQGWDMALVQKRLGHKSIQTTINIYTHLSSEDLKNAIKKYGIRSLADEIVKS